MFKFLALIVLPTVLLAQPNAVNHAIDSLFRAIDISRDGRLVPIEVEAYFLSFDINGDEELSHQEFNRAVDQGSGHFRGHEAQLYNLFDQDTNGNLTKSDIDASFVRADRNNDTHLTDPEFRAFINSVHVVVG